VKFAKFGNSGAIAVLFRIRPRDSTALLQFRSIRSPRILLRGRERSASDTRVRSPSPSRSFVRWLVGWFVRSFVRQREKSFAGGKIRRARIKSLASNLNDLSRGPRQSPGDRTIVRVRWRAKRLKSPMCNACFCGTVRAFPIREATTKPSATTARLRERRKEGVSLAKAFLGSAVSHDRVFRLVGSILIGHQHHGTAEPSFNHDRDPLSIDVPITRLRDTKISMREIPRAGKNLSPSDVGLRVSSVRRGLARRGLLVSRSSSI